MTRFLALVCTALMLLPPLGAAAESFKFAVLGDMPYGNPAETHPKFRALIGIINERKPAFTIHVGDIKSGADPCSDALLDEQLAFMGMFENPLVYTPGDNEWTDCHKQSAGNYDPIERLAKLRAKFFASPQSLGKQPRSLERQSDVMPGFEAFVENARFANGEVLFVTLHVVGSNNSLEPRSRAAASEFFDRDAANIAWLRDTFAKAKAEDAKALVVAMQADMFEFDFGHFGKDEHLSHSGFRNISDALVQEANTFGRPVLLIYGDSHKFLMHAPYRKRAPRLIGLEVFGADQMHAVEVHVDTTEPAVFSIRPIWNSLP